MTLDSDFSLIRPVTGTSSNGGLDPVGTGKEKKRKKKKNNGKRQRFSGSQVPEASKADDEHLDFCA